MIILDRTLAENKQDFLWYIFNNLGCRELTLAYSYKDKDDNLRFSKWLKYEELEKYNPNDYIESVYCTKQQFIEKVSHRSVLDIEILMDIDDKGKYKTIKNKAIAICKKLKGKKIDYVCSFTGSKSYHISILIPEFRNIQKEQLRQIKQLRLNKFNVDTQKSSVRSMIALEGEHHYKSGKIKEKVLL